MAICNVPNLPPAPIFDALLPRFAASPTYGVAADAEEWMVFGDEEVRIVLRNELRESTRSDSLPPTSASVLSGDGRHT